MITGAHVILYSKDAAADRAFLRDALGLPFVDSGHDWLIFKLPPAEIGVHPDEAGGRHELSLVSDDLAADVAALEAKGVRCSEIRQQGWGQITLIDLPGGSRLGLYQPRHPTAFHL